jgi:D,D-heptose 1,7-bisphosphate phosphatase
VNAAFYIMEKSALAGYSGAPGKRDFGKDLFPEMIRNGVAIHGYESREYIKDMGTPKRLEKVRADFASGLVAARNFSNPCPAVFLDRDGTLNPDKGWIRSPDQVELLEGAGEAVRQINKSGFLAVLVTNQPVIARGECTFEGMESIHARLEMLLGEHDAYLDAIYFCPHHPEPGWPGERRELKIDCDCRKPKPGMVRQAARDLNIDLSRSFLVGDSWRDMEAAKNAGITGIRVGGKGSGCARGLGLEHLPGPVANPFP